MHPGQLTLAFSNCQRAFLSWLGWQKLICLWLLLSNKVRLAFQSYIGIYSWLFLFHSSDLLKFPLLNVQTLTLPPFWLRLGKIQGLFKDIPQISSFQGLFKAPANHVEQNMPWLPIYSLQILSVYVGLFFPIIGSKYVWNK